MTAHQPDQIRTMQQAAADGGGARAHTILHDELEALFELSNQLARSAGLAEESFQDMFGEALPGLNGPTDAVDEGLVLLIQDIRAMLSPGMSALHTLASRGAPCSVPALALWRELYAARAALIETMVSLARVRPSSS